MVTLSHNNLGVKTHLSLPRAIVFDDEQQFLIPFTNFLKRKNILVDAYTEYEDALKAISDRDYDGGVFDINDANLNQVGLDLAQQFNDKFSSTDAPCFCITGYPDFEYRVQEVGATLIVKPFSPEKAGRDIWVSIWAHFLARLPKGSLSPYVATVEHLQDDILTVSFRDAATGWVLVDIKKPRDLKLSPGDITLISELYNDLGKLLGFRILPQPTGTHHHAIGPQLPKDFNDVEQFEKYMEELRRFLGEHE